MQLFVPSMNEKRSCMSQAFPDEHQMAASGLGSKEETPTIWISESGIILYSFQFVAQCAVRLRGTFSGPATSDANRGTNKL
jgi:hypothetical protein